jgi:hypothetical protein
MCSGRTPEFFPVLSGWNMSLDLEALRLGPGPGPGFQADLNLSKQFGDSVPAAGFTTLFDARPVCFISQDMFLRTLASAGFLPAVFGDLRFGFGNAGVFLSFNFVQEQLAREKAVHPLLPSGLALYLNTRRPVHQHHTSRGLVYVLTAVPGRPDECFFQIRFTDSRSGHPGQQLIFFLRTD